MGPRPSMQQKGRHCGQYSPFRKEVPLQRFFKIILPSTIDDKKLSLPPLFVRKYGKELSDVAKLNVSSTGRVWNVGVTKGRNNYWCFDEGWHEFATYHAIGIGYFLVFEYESLSNFNVLVFSKSACEIPYTCDDDPLSNDDDDDNNNKLCSFYQSEGMDDSDDNSVEILGCKFNFYPNTRRDSSRKLRSSSRKHRLPDASPADKQRLQQACQGDGRTCRMEEEDRVLEIETFNNVDCKEKIEHKGGGEKEICISKMLNSALSRMPSECKRAVERALEFKPQNPSFLVLVRQHHLHNGLMFVPSSFAKRYMPAISETIRVESTCDGREWFVKSCWIRRGGNLIIKRGWKDFFSDNSLVEGDVCLFEMIKMKNITLKASVVRAHWR